MKIRLENVNYNSDSGPNSFAKKLAKYVELQGHVINWQNYDAVLCFIETVNEFPEKKLFQRLDGIYFNSDFNFQKQNSNIQKTYHRADGVIFQSNFNKELTYKFFGEHENHTIIHNGADLEFIERIIPLKNDILDKYENVWACAANWRPHKRLEENIRYFLEHRGPNDCMVIAGNAAPNNKLSDVFYTGNLPYQDLLSLYKRSAYFIHLAWLDHCPNVVVDARASGCKIICSSAGGTREVAGLDAIVIEEDVWDYMPTKLYNPPSMDFTRKLKNSFDVDYDMITVAKKYLEFMNELV